LLFREAFPAQKCSAHATVTAFSGLRTVILSIIGAVTPRRLGHQNLVCERWVHYVKVTLLIY